MKKYIEIKDNNFTPTSEEYNVVEVDVRYKKGYWVVLFLQEWELKNEWVFQSFSFDMFWSKKYNQVIHPMKRDNKKKVAEVTENFFNTHSDDVLLSLLK